MNEDPKVSKEAKTIGLVFALIVLGCVAAIFVALTWNLISWILNI